MKRFAAIAGFVAALGVATSMSSATTVQSFDNFNLTTLYGSWGAPFTTLTSGPTGFTVTSQHYGSGYAYLGSTIDASGTDTVQVDVTVTEGVAGCIFDVSDDNGNGQSFKFYGLVPGGGTNGGNNYVLTMPLTPTVDNYFSGTGVLNTSILTNLNIEIDPGPYTGEYSATFNDLSFISSANAPEPTGLAMLGAGCMIAARRRRA